jgi:S-adenosyl-L-methionine hydrolase (adenosine-forming)
MRTGRRRSDLADGCTRPLIALLTDFGTDDWYVGTIKGVIKGICPGADIVDISHAVAAQSVIEASFMLSAACGYYPPETIFVVVVDPGVGTSREPIVARGDTQWFIAPNNGILGAVMQHSKRWECRKLSNPKYHLPAPGDTFHARDVFAPAAAHLAAGVPWTELAPDPAECFGLASSAPSYDRGIIEGNIIYFDHFGNALSNIPRALYDKNMMLREAGAKGTTGRKKGARKTAEVQFVPAIAIYVGNYVLPTISKTYADAKIGEALAYWGSTGLLEIGVNHGSARQKLTLKLLDKVTIKRVGKRIA